MKGLPRTNELRNLDEFKGQDGGPSNVVEIHGVRTVIGRLGGFSPDLPSEYFDVVFSISVVEHLITRESISAFCRDGARVLKRGGLMYHAIDLYLKDDTFDFSSQRVSHYLELTEPDGLLFLETPKIDPNIRFHCCYATNPDLSMFAWNNAVPSLTELRLNAQSSQFNINTA